MAKLRFAVSDELLPDDHPLDSDDDLLLMYMREISKIPVLSKEREQELFKRMDRARRGIKRILSSLRREHSGRRLDGWRDVEELARSLPDGPKREKLLKAAERIRELEEKANAAREEIIKGNLRLPLFIARRYYRDKGLPLLDLIQEGNAGLMMAVDRFDWRKGAKFSSYASIWIQQAIGYAIANHSRTVRLPVYLHDMVRRVVKAAEEFTVENSRRPTLEELARITGLSKEKVEKALKLSQGVASLDDFISEEESRAIDFLPDTRETPEEEVERKLMREEVERALNSLPERERRILRIRYGFEDGKPHSLQEVGRRLNISRERVRQIETRALNRLRHPSRSSRLRELLT